jgi:hypothetical protein
VTVTPSEPATLTPTLVASAVIPSGQMSVDRGGQLDPRIVPFAPVPTPVARSARSDPSRTDLVGLAPASVSLPVTSTPWVIR